MSTIGRLGESVRRVREFGIGDLGKRVVRRLSDAVDVDSLSFPLFDEDVADSTRLPVRPQHVRIQGKPVIGWVCTPPRPGSGGHTTLFRMVAAVEAAGYACVLFLYDRHRGDFNRHTAVIRQHWPALRAQIRDATDGIAGVDACVASSWETAHVLVSRVTKDLPLLYFVQDFEPYFYPRGALYALAEDSYRFGLRTIALGEMVRSELAALGVPSTFAPFGCDTDIYTRTNSGEREGIVFFARAGADRRGYLLGRLALEEFSARHPEQPIHVYGGALRDVGFPTVQHGTISPQALNDLYNRTRAGIALSFTNISLVAEELLAAGAIPIVNESEHARLVLKHPEVEWAVPTPGGIADALCRVVEDPTFTERSKRAASIKGAGWGPTQRVVVEEIVRALGEPVTPA